MAIETRTGSGGTTYLQLDFGKKSMYIYSADEKEGFEKHTSAKGKETYRQYVNAISGKITSAYFREGSFGPEFVLIFTDEDGRYSVQMGIEDSIFQNLARSIQNIDISKTVRFSVYGSKSKTSDKVYFSLSLSYPEDLDSEGKAKLVEWGDEFPAGKQLRNGKWDFSEANDEAYGRVEEFIKSNSFDTQTNTQVETPKEEKIVKNKKEKTKPDTEDEDDDLPFN